jgi:gamma-tubulin complex component 2
LPGGACISPLLESWKHKILLAGKYLNVIRECGIDVPRDHTISEDEDLSMENERYGNDYPVPCTPNNGFLRRFYKFIEDAYSHANRTLLQLLLKDQQLIPRLRSLKRYFFLSQSSFLTHLLDLASAELRKSSKSASTARLQNLLDLSLNTDSVGEDPLFKEDIKITMADTGLYDFLLKIVTVSGVVKPEEVGSMEEEPKKDDKKSMQGM